MLAPAVLIANLAPALPIQTPSPDPAARIAAGADASLAQTRARSAPLPCGHRVVAFVGISFPAPARSPVSGVGAARRTAPLVVPTILASPETGSRI